ncbi:MAG: phospho-sugar mutase [Peptococcaceae bacterium]|nr:phospho-sugar mutase [Peptococcaceae bacterium]
MVRQGKALINPALEDNLEDRVRERYKFWTECDYFDSATRQELLSLQDPKEISERFYTDLEFGTGGMRGIIGAGTNRINKYVVRKITQGLADTIIEQGKEACKRGVVIAYDSRRNSAEFAMETALVLAANGIRAFLFDRLKPTPELSFAVRFLGTIAGVNITASHNPKEYNGYKVYGEDGGQVPPAQALKIVEKIHSQIDWRIPVLSLKEAKERGLLLEIGSDVDLAYYMEIKESLLYPELSRAKGSRLKIVYTPLHGAGNEPVRSILHDIGFTSVFTVPEQEKPDCEFSTVKLPNPEDPAAFELALKYATERQADIILATDPDADRLGLYAKDQDGSFHRFTGNQIGVILAYYLISQRQKLGRLPKDGKLVKTVASTELGDAVAAHFGLETINVLVGFKYIGEQIKEMEEKETGSFIFGFEESHGYLAGTYARDKDAVQASALLAEAALYYREKENKTLPQVLEEIFRLCGYYIDEQVAISLEGREGKENINKIMDYLRKKKPAAFGGLTVKSMDDFFHRKTYFMIENKEREMGAPLLPPENVLRLRFEQGGFIMARPSGTEPKIRFYFCLKGNSMTSLKETLNNVKADFLEVIYNVLGFRPIK